MNMEDGYIKERIIWQPHFYTPHHDMDWPTSMRNTFGYLLVSPGQENKNCTQTFS
jgi:hypothetical protein